MTQLESYAQHYRDAQVILHSIADDLSDEAFNWKPDPKSWSVGECVVHLNKSSKGYLGRLEAAVTQGSPQAQGPFTYGWVTRSFINGVRPGSRSMNTFRSLRPPETTSTLSAVDRSQALDRYDADTNRFLQIIEAAEGLDLSRIKVRTPFLPILRFELGGLIEALGLHALRHVQQAERVTRTTGFPSD